MKITVQSSKLVKPAYVHSHHGGVLSGVADAVPLTVFDKANFDQYISGINFFRPPSSHPNHAAALEAGLARALAEYREWAGRLGVDVDGNRVIHLNDAGARFVEGTAEVALSSVMPLEPSPELLNLYPDGEAASDGELMLVQVTRFACGAVAVGHTMHHIVADGRATCNVLLAWGQATRGVPFDPVPVHDRSSFFVPRSPPQVEFQHRGVEFKPREEKAAPGSGNGVNDDTIVVHRARFSKEFVSELKSRASAGASRPYSTLQCLVAHLWRCVTVARGLNDHQVTKLRVAVDGRARLTNPRVPDGYTGNVVLWACPTTRAHHLVNTPLQHAVELINRAVRRVDEAYFKSFIDFASSGTAEAENLGPASDVTETVLSPDLELDSLLHAPFYEMDFGDGPPFLFMPGYLTVEGAVFVVRSFAGDSSVDAYVPLLSRAVDAFKSCCYTLPPLLMAAEARL